MNKREHDKIYYEKNKERLKAKAKARYEAKKELIKKQSMERYYANHEENKAKMRARMSPNAYERVCLTCDKEFKAKGNRALYCSISCKSKAQYRRSDKGKLNKSKREYYQKNKEHFIKLNKINYQNNKEDYKNRQREWINNIGTIKLVEDRIKTLETLKEMVYSDDIYFLESDLQKIIEEHFWIFGDEYNFMIASEEDDFTKLRNIYYDKVLKIAKDEYEQYKISRKQVDLFISGLVSEGKSIKNLVVEIKKPSKPIGMEEYKQIETYSEIIKNESQFNGFNHNWDFLLVGKDFSDDYIPDLYIDQSRGLVKEIKNKKIRIFCLRWIDLLEGVKFRLDFLKNKLEVKKSHLGVVETKEKEVLFGETQKELQSIYFK